MAQISRREFLRVTAIAAAGVAVAACAKTPTTAPATATAQPKAAATNTPQPKVEPTATPKVETKAAGKEAPMLAALVTAGKLPPVADRIGADPQIVKVAHEIGVYGGMMTVVNPAADAYHSARTGVGIEGVLRIAENLKEALPNKIKSFEFSPDGKIFTATLRQGMKWADGEPVTADDYTFWYEYVVLNDELSPTKPTWFKPAGKLAKVEKIDDLTIRYVFEDPYPFVVKYLAHWDGTGIVMPAHYDKQWHIAFTDKAKLEALAKEKGYDTWNALFSRMCAINSGQAIHNPDQPCLNMVQLKEEAQDHWLLDRNPYYWKTDTDGNQLPYVDKTYVRIILDAQAQVGAMISGEDDIEFGWMPAVTDWPLYKQGEAAGKYKAFTVPYATGGILIFQPNLTYKGDTVLRDIFREAKFRQALSMAINRDEINQLLYFGKARPSQATVVPTCSFWDEESAKLYIDYSPDKANALLDEMGLKWDSAKQWRTRSDGQKLAWTIESQIDPTKDKTWQLVSQYWQKIGCDVQVKTLTGELTQQRYPSNDVQMGTWGADKATDWLFPTTPQFWVPYNQGWESTMYPLWTTWEITAGKEGEEPPQKVKDLWDWWQAMKTSVDVAKQVEYGKKIVKRNNEEVYVIGTLASPPQVVIIKDNLMNVPTAEEGLEFGWDYFQFYPWHSEQLYFKAPLYPRQEVK